MSVIQDALKRKLLEQERGSSAKAARPSGASIPPQTPPVAQQVYQRESALQQRAAPIQPDVRVVQVTQGGAGKWMLGTALVLLFAILVAGVLYYMMQGVPLTQVNPPQAVAPAPAQPAQAVPAPASTPAQVEPPGPTVLMGPGQTVVRPAAEPAIAVVAAPPLAGQWPDITVDGVLAGSTAKKSSAILNGEMIFLNQKIEGVRLIGVSNEGVRLRFNDEEIDLEIGQMTNDRD